MKINIWSAVGALATLVLAGCAGASTTPEASYTTRASADPTLSAEDVAFLEALAVNDLIVSPGQIPVWRGVCTKIGASEDIAVDGYRNDVGRLGETKAGRFWTAAVETYCPDLVAALPAIQERAASEAAAEAAAKADADSDGTVDSLDIAPNNRAIQTLDDVRATLQESCDYLLDFDNGHTFVASAFINGTLGAVVDVTATWRQISGNHVTATQQVTLQGAGRGEAYFSQPATRQNIQEIQALPYDQQCSVEATIVGFAG